MLTLKRSELRLAEELAGSRGNQPKYLYGSSWVKTDFLGYEGLSEVVASRLAAALGLDHVEYRPCIVEMPQRKVFGCISEDFAKGAAETTLGSILENVMPRDFDITRLATTADRVEAVCEATERFIPRGELLDYLNTMLSFDKLIFNEDRHLFNIIFLVNDDGTLRRAPLFDNGAGLFSDETMSFGRSMPVRTCINKVKSKPFSTDFRKQVGYLNSLCGDPFEDIQLVKIHTADLYDYYPADCVSRALSALRLSLEKHGIGLSVRSEENTSEKKNS